MRAIHLIMCLAHSYAHLFDSCHSDVRGKDSIPLLTLVRHNIRTLSIDEQLAVQTLPGYLARTEPKLALITKAEDLVWMKTMCAETEDVTSLGEVLKELPVKNCSYVLCNIGDNSTNAALSFAAARDDCVIVATESTKQTLEAHGIKLSMDVTGAKHDPMWALDRYAAGTFSAHVSVLQNAKNPVPLSDFTIKCRALNWWGWGECGKKLKNGSIMERALGL